MGASSFAPSASRHGAGPGAPTDPPRFRPQIVRSLRQHRVLAVGVATIVCLCLVGMGLKQGKVYVAQSLVYVEPTTPGNVISEGSAGFDQTRYASYLDQQMQTVTRPDILAAAIGTLPVGTWAFPGETTQGAAARLQKSLTVERLLTGYDLSIKLSTPNAEHSAAIVNAVTNAYLAGGRKDELAQAGGREQILSEERQRIAEELEADRKEQAALGLNLGLANPVGESGNPFDLQLVNLRAQLAAAREAHDIAAAQLSSVSGSATDQQSGLAAVADEAINTDQGLASLKSAMNARRAVLEAEMAGMTPTNPRFKQDQDEIADLERSLDSATDKARGLAARRIQDKLHVELQRTGAVEGQLNAQLAQETAKATGAGPKLQRAAELAVDIGRLHSRYTEVDGALRGLQLETNGPGMAHLALAASIPTSPESNHQKLYFLMALPFGIMCGIAAAVLARARDRRIFVGADLEQVVGFAPMAVLPARGEVARGVLDEYVLRLAAAVEGAYRTRSARTFVITAVSGKTDTRMLLQALAQKLEDLRLKVLVLHGRDLLVASQETAEYRLRAPDSTAGEGIAAAKLERFKRENDIILVDAAPMLHSAETEYAARCADATILVAESGVTLSTELSEATALLARLQVQGVGVVLQELSLKDADANFKTAISVIEQRGEIRPEPRIARPAEPPAVEADPVPEAHTADSPSVWTSQDAILAEREPVTPAPIEIRAEAHGEAAPVVHERESMPPVGLTVESAHFGSADAHHEVVSSVREGLRRFHRGPAEDRMPEPKELHDANGLQTSASGLHRAQEPGVMPAGGIASQLTQLPRAEESVPSFFAGNQPSGRFIGNTDLVSTVPLDTRSKIRLAFKEQEVNSNTTWYSKLFRGDPHSVLRASSNGDGEEASTEELLLDERVPEFNAPEEPGLEHLLNGIHNGARKQELAPKPELAVAEKEGERVAPFVAVDAEENRPAGDRILRPLSSQAHEGDSSARASAPTGSEVSPVVVPGPIENPTPSTPMIWPAKSTLPSEAGPAPRVQPVQVVTEIPSFTPTDVEAVDSDVVPVPLLEELVPEMNSLRFQPRTTAASKSSSPDKAVRLPYSSEASAVRRRANALLPRSESGLQPIPLLRPPAETARVSRSEMISPTPIHSGENWHRLPEAPALEAPQVEETESPAIRGLSRRWALLSHYDPSVTDPAPAGRSVKPRFVESSPQKTNEA